MKYKVRSHVSLRKPPRSNEFSTSAGACVPTLGTEPVLLFSASLALGDGCEWEWRYLIAAVTKANTLEFITTLM